MVRWMFVFWIGQVAAAVGIIFVVMKAGR